ncbi:MAG: PilN domain-containing protein [Planctomycetota bacterium]|jgi:Tfp pilus assembly protein PilN
MLNVNFIPEGYLSGNESRRTNLMYLILLLVLMAAVGSCFVVIKVRQKALGLKEEMVNSKIIQAQGAIKKFDELQRKRKDMMRTALITADLLEPVPRSVILAYLTNNLPTGVSLVKVKLVQQVPKAVPQAEKAANLTKYQQAKAQKSPEKTQTQLSHEKLLKTHIDIGGLAPSDLQVAAYIEALGSSNLLEKVALVESKEYEIEGVTLRKFRLTAMLAASR